jgi:hypothetical protein
MARMNMNARPVMRLVAAVQLVCIAPAALFLTSVLVGAGDNPPRFGLAIQSRRLVAWFATHGTVAPLLILLPLAALAVGGATLLQMRRPATFATLVVAWATGTSACILAIVVLHALAN